MDPGSDHGIIVVWGHAKNLNKKQKLRTFYTVLCTPEQRWYTYLYIFYEHITLKYVTLG